MDICSGNKSDEVATFRNPSLSGVELSEPLLMNDNDDHLSHSSSSSSGADEMKSDVGEDVLAERRRVEKGSDRSDQSRAGESKDDREALRVRILGLKKVFPGRGGAPSKVAVSPLYLGINEHECLGLLVSGYRMWIVDHVLGS